MASATERNNTQANNNDDLQALYSALPGEGLPEPDAPGLLGTPEINDDVGLKQGNIGHYGLTDDLTPTLHGSIDGGDGLVLQIYANTKYLGTAVIADGGDWEFTTQQLQAGSKYTFEVLLKDPLSAETLVAMPYTIITTESGMDRLTPPELGGILDDVGNDRGLIHSGDATDDARPSVFGSADAGSVVVILDNGSVIGSTLADDKGSWAFTPGSDLADGSHSFAAIVQDPASNTSSAASEAIDFTVDTSDSSGGKGWDTPIITAYQFTGTEIGVQLDVEWRPDGYRETHSYNLPAAQTHISLTGLANPGSTVYIYPNGSTTALGTAEVDASGHWTFDTNLGTGGGSPFAGYSRGWTARASENGEMSESSPVFGIEYSTTLIPVNSPYILAAYDNLGDNQGWVPNGGNTDDTTILLTGTGVAGSTLYLYRLPNSGEGVSSMGSVVVDSNGHWSLAPEETTTNVGTWGSSVNLYQVSTSSTFNFADPGLSNRFYIKTVVPNHDVTDVRIDDPATSFYHPAGAEGAATLLQQPSPEAVAHQQNEHHETLNLAAEELLSQARQEIFTDGSQHQAGTQAASEAVELKLEEVSQQWQNIGDSLLTGKSNDAYQGQENSTDLLIHQGGDLHG